MYYRIAEKLAEEPRGAQNGWQGLAAVLRPEELAACLRKMGKEVKLSYF